MTTARQTPGSPSELDALRALAQREHRAGRLAAAEAAYRKILVLRPDLAEAHTDLGILFAQRGQLDLAMARFEQAIVLKPGLPGAHYNLGNFLLSQGKLDEAAARYEQALILRPNFAEAYNNLGNILLSQGKLDEAAARYEQALALRPDLAETHYNLGKTLLNQGKLDQAAARYQQAVALRPDYAEAYNNLGVVLWRQGELGQAVAYFEQAIALHPEYAEAHSDLGSLLLSQGKFDEAVARYEQAIALRPDYPETHYNLGNALKRQGKLDQALARFDLALALRPDYLEALTNLGNILLSEGKLDEAAARYEQALALRPDLAETHYNLGKTSLTQGKLGEAATQFRRAMALRPGYADAEIDLAICYLVEGDYERGWSMYEARLRTPEFLPQGLKLPRWTGEPLAGRSLLLVAEQGLGDTIHFIRFARALKEPGARVVLACPAALGRLLAVHPDVDELFLLGSAAELPCCDFYLPLLSAPLALGTTASTIPCEVPYLAADSELTARWRRELAGIDGFKIGIVWQGSRDYFLDRWRSIPLADFAPLAGVPGVRLISLQKGFGSEQVATVDFPVLDLAGRLDDVAGPFMDTAAVIANLDLVVTANTAIAHLAGALGAPVWLALHFSPDWRWPQDRDDSPWYPSMRLFRQTTFGQWPDVFERIADAVRARRTPANAEPATAD